MGKYEGSWSGMRRYLEHDMLAPSLYGRVRYGCTAYVGMDGSRIFEICIDGRPVKHFSLETVNTWFLDNGYRPGPRPVGLGEYWDGLWMLLDEVPRSRRTAYTDDEFCDALAAYRTQDIAASLHSEDPLVRMLAILDRRVGKRTLSALRDTVSQQPEWLQNFYRLRMDAEDSQHKLSKKVSPFFDKPKKQCRGACRGTAFLHIMPFGPSGPYNGTRQARARRQTAP